MTQALNPANGVGQKTSAPMDADEKAFKCAVKDCDEMAVTPEQKEALKRSAKKGGDEMCKHLGRLKHECVSEKVKDRKDCASESAWDTDMKPPTQLMQKGKPCMGVGQGWASMRRRLKWLRPKKKYVNGRMRMPDFLIGKPPRKLLDAKFPCTFDVLKGKLHAGKRFPSAPKPGVFREGQKEAYEKILGKGKGKGEPEAVSPKDVENLDCS
jgi:hypothetical protein